MPKIAGHDVQFPHQPYGVQYSFMAKVIQTVANRENALLEAPTGSGKTLSLLCSALSWQRKLKQEGYSEAWEGRPNIPDDGQGQETPEGKSVKTPPEPISCTPPGSGSAGSTEGEVTPNGAPPREPLPRIFYATRTHSQIAQVVRELKRTGYTPSMGVLASRSHYCVHSGVSKKPNVDEECEKLLEDRSCRYFNNLPKVLNGLATYVPQVHDIEDLVQVGKEIKACPYFVARKIAEHAELLFCPYNYLIDPVIRSSMGINIQHAVIIFDEAHNIEDISRDAASVEMERASMVDVQKAFEYKCLEADSREIYGPLADAFGRFANWLKERCERPDVRKQQGAGQRYEGITSGLQMREELEEAGLGKEQVDLLHELYVKARAEEQKKEEPPAPALAEEDGASEHQLQNVASSQAKKKGAGFALGQTSRLLTILNLMYSSNVSDYRLALQRWYRSSQPRRRGRRREDDEEDEVAGWALQFCLWCLNPAVAFHSIAAAARSIILTSGTLSPLDSFASELDTSFPVRFEAPHVINARLQVWAGSICAGPDDVKIAATYEHSLKPDFQDSVGASIAAIAGIVPDGLLVFLPSYVMLDRLMERWKVTGVWAQLQQTKAIVCEPRGTGDAFDAVMSDFYTAIREGRGAIFFAICRGKVSEGLDFTDKNARAVIVVGIPFPNVKDTKVNLKKKYNDAGQRDRSRSLLTGDQWYSQQAFRALNQAVGRCIRHKLDYGAIVLLDRRFSNTANQRHLSRWVRTSINVHESFAPALESMKEFFARLEANPPGNVLPKEPEYPAAKDARTGAAGQNEKTQLKEDAKSSQFASHSQPTLNAVWKHVPSRLRQLPGRPCPPAQRVPALKMEPLPPNHCDAEPAPAALEPAEAQLPPTQTRGRGVEAVFGSALDPTSPASEASTLPPGSGETHPEPRLNSHAEASTSAMFSGGTRRGDGQSSAGPRDAWQSGQQGSYRDFAQREAPIHRSTVEAASPARSTLQPTPGQAPTLAQDTLSPQRPWQQAPANAAQHLMSRSGLHRGRGRGGAPGLLQSPGGPSPSQWGAPNPASFTEQQQQRWGAEDSPGHLHAASSNQSGGLQHGNQPSWPQQSGSGAQESPRESARDTNTQDWVNRCGAPPAWQQPGHVSHDSPGGSCTLAGGDQQVGTPAWQQPGHVSHDSPGGSQTAVRSGQQAGTPAWQQQQQQVLQGGGAHGGPGGNSGRTPGGLVSASWQAQRLPGQLHCPETPPSVSGRDHASWQPAAFSARITHPPHSLAAAATHASAAPTSPPPLQQEAAVREMQAAWTDGECQWVNGQEEASALVELLPVSVVQEWLRADVAENVAYLLNEPGVMHNDMAEVEEKAHEAIQFCFDYARELLEEGGELEQLLNSWACPPPMGMQAIAAACGCGAEPPPLPGMVAAASAALLAHLQSLPSLQAVQEMQAVYAEAGELSFVSSTPVRTQQYASAPQPDAAAWPQSLPNRASVGSASSDSAVDGSGIFTPPHVRSGMLQPPSGAEPHSEGGGYGSPAVPVRDSEAAAEPVPWRSPLPQSDAPLRAPLSPTAANRGREPSFAGEAKLLQAGAEGRTGPKSHAAPLGRDDSGSGGRSGQKRGSDGGNKGGSGGNPAPDQDAAGHERKRCALSRNQAEALARRGGQAAGPRLAAWTQNSDDTDDFMM